LINTELSSNLLSWKLKTHLNGEIDEQELCDWNNSMYMRLMFENLRFLDLDIIPLVAIMKKIDDLVQDKRCIGIARKQENLKRMAQMLDGTIDETHYYSFRLPDSNTLPGTAYFRKNMKYTEKLSDIIEKLISKEALQDNEIRFISGIDKGLGRAKTVTELIYANVATLLSHYDVVWNSFSGVCRYFSSPKESEDNSVNNWVPLQRVKKVVNCYLGRESFIIVSTFKSGKATVMIMT
jgi:hypothetical protein